MQLPTPLNQEMPSNTVLSSKKTEATHLVTPRSIEQNTPASPCHHHDKTMINKHIINASLFITNTWNHQQVPSLFKTQPNTSFTNYLTEILKRSRCSMSALHAALFYINKLSTKIHLKNDKSLQCPKKVFLICLILSFKFQYDSTYNLKAWSKISGLSIGELKQLEMSILSLLDYKIALNNKEYTSWLAKVEAINNQPPKRRREDDIIESSKKLKIACA